MDNSRYRYTVKEDEQIRSLWNEGVPIAELALQMRRSKGSLSQRIGKLRSEGHYLMAAIDRFAAVRDWKLKQQHQDGIDALESSLETHDESLLEPEPEQNLKPTELPDDDLPPTPIKLRDGWSVKVTVSCDGQESLTWEAPLHELVDYSVALTKILSIITTQREAHE